jgi:uncharacterized membrane protein YphA (DoxX/SURF4 family)
VTPFTKARLAASWLASLYFARLYAQAGWQKFETNSFWTGLFVVWGYPPSFRILVGIVEVGAGVAIVVPWVSTYAAATLIVVMGGAWVHLAMDARWGDVGTVTAYLTGLAWIAWEWRSWRLQSSLRSNT